MTQAIEYPVQLPSAPTIYRGYPYSVQLAMVQADGVTSVDLTPYGTTWAAQLRTSMSETIEDADFAVNVSTLTSGYITISLTASQTTLLVRGQSYGFDVQAMGGTITPFPVWICDRVPCDGNYTRA